MGLHWAVGGKAVVIFHGRPQDVRMQSISIPTAPALQCMHRRTGPAVRRSDLPYCAAASATAEASPQQAVEAAVHQVSHHLTDH